MTEETAPHVDRPILFSGPMVRAILQCQKTQTRRIVKPLRGWEKHSVCRPDMAADPWAVWWHYPETDRVGHLAECPHGKPGDRLWVRETWALLGDHAALHQATNIGYPVERWRPSIHMPRWASRLSLEITDVRVEQLSDITWDDAEREGITNPRDGCLIEEYAILWDQLNEKRGYGWESNPWVWVISFKRLEQ